MFISGIIGKNDFEYNLNNKKNYLYRKIKTEKFSGVSYVNKKFINDKIAIETDKYIVITDGVLLNSKELMNQYKSKNIHSLIATMYIKLGEDFMKEFRGSFSGIFYDKISDKFIIFTNHVGDKRIYYYNNNNNIVFSSHLDYILSYLKNNNLEYNYDREGILYLLTQGFMLDNYTLVKDIKKLLPGQYILVEKNNFKVKEYYSLNNEELLYETEDEIIENIDKLFKQAVKRQFEKDIEYGYNHLASLSGGLDSRMTNFVAKSLGYENILNYTFSQSNYIDDKISKEIASYLNNEYIFKNLDDAKFLRLLEDVIKLNSGTSIYYGIAHSKKMLDSLNVDNYGIVHTGQLGDVILGTFFSNSKRNSKADISKFAYSKRALNMLDIDKINYLKNEEIFNFYNRGFNGALSGNLAFQENLESFSPFYDVDFMDYCLKIPVKLRKDHYIYYKWVKNKYYDAANFYYEKRKGKITTPKVIINIRFGTIRIINKVLKILGFKGIFGNDTKNAMNPFDYWYKENNYFKEFVDKYYFDNIENINIDSDILKKIKEMFEFGITTEKLQVLTLLAFNNIYFIDKNRERL